MNRREDIVCRRAGRGKVQKVLPYVMGAACLGMSGSGSATAPANLSPYMLYDCR